MFELISYVSKYSSEQIPSSKLQLRVPTDSACSRDGFLSDPAIPRRASWPLKRLAAALTVGGKRTGAGWRRHSFFGVLTEHTRVQTYA